MTTLQRSCLFTSSVMVSIQYSGVSELQEWTQLNNNWPDSFWTGLLDINSWCYCCGKHFRVYLIGINLGISTSYIMAESKIQYLVCKGLRTAFKCYTFVYKYNLAVMFFTLMTINIFFLRMSIYFRLHNIPGVFQRSQGNGPLNRLLVAAKRKYMDTELPPQESEGKVASKFRKLTVAFIWALDSGSTYICFIIPPQKKKKD